jgi:hypothetical protein
VSLADTDPYEYVLDLNVRLRHLSESQRAMLAAGFANLKDGVNKGSHKEGTQICVPSQPEYSQKDAAKLMNVSPRSVQNATRVRARAVPELKALVEQDKLSVNAAADLAELPEEVEADRVSARVSHRLSQRLPARRRSSL